MVHQSKGTFSWHQLAQIGWMQHSCKGKGVQLFEMCKKRGSYMSAPFVADTEDLT